MKFGKFNLFIISDGQFWLDGGAMFGIVPKILWNKLNPADEMNRIELGLNCLLIQSPENNILVDTGLGKKIDEKFKEMYRVEKESNLIEGLKKIGLNPEDVDFVINTHLHFDHCGGNTIFSHRDSVAKCSGRPWSANKNIIPTFPKAKYVIQRQEWQDAINPNERTKASYLKENFIPLEENNQLLLVEGAYEVIKGVKVIVTNGHTQGHQSVLIESDRSKAIYFGDLIPTTSHIKIPYVMGYDLYPLDLIKRKEDILKRALSEHWLLIFEHDPEVVFAYVIEENGKAILQSLHNEI
jgi:glyoxylase-like metal-dependent hydrolase (beta-lactamase superfamily II)